MFHRICCVDMHDTIVDGSLMEGVMAMRLCCVSLRNNNLVGMTTTAIILLVFDWNQKTPTNVLNRKVNTEFEVKILV